MYFDLGWCSVAVGRLCGLSCVLVFSRWQLLRFSFLIMAFVKRFSRARHMTFFQTTSSGALPQTLSASSLVQNIRNLQWPTILFRCVLPDN